MQGEFYNYCRLYGIWVKEITGLDPVKDAEAVNKLRPIANISKDYPPTFQVHGTKDDDVPYKGAVRMRDALTVKGIENELLSFPVGHEGLRFIKGDIEKKALLFLKKYLKGEKHE